MLLYIISAEKHWTAEVRDKRQNKQDNKGVLDKEMQSEEKDEIPCWEVGC